MSLPPLTAMDVDLLVARFYDRLLADPQMKAYFEGVDLHAHLPHIARFWGMALFGAPGYRGDVMSAHVHVHARLPLDTAQFDRWIGHFEATLDAHFSGDKVEEAKQRARSIAAVMQHRLTQV